MKIGIDGNEANIAKRVGSNVYAYRIIQELNRLGQKTQWRMYLKRPPLPDMPKKASDWQYSVFGPPFFWTRWRLPLKLFLEKDKPDIFFSPSHYAPWFSPVPTVITIMDLAFLRYPKDYRPQDLEKLRFWTRRSAKKAAHILAISQATKEDIINFYGVSKDKITVTYLGYDENRFKQNSASQKTKQILTRYGVGKEYLVYVGTLQPRKNLRRLLRAFSYIAPKFPQLQLVLVGKKGWLYNDIFKTAQQLGLRDRVIFTGYVPDEEVPALISQARAYVLPSLFEGFGIPIIEAMACGVPVVVSKVSSLPELAGPAGLYIKNPKSIREISEALVRMIELPQRKRQALIQKGLNQVKQFSWEKCGQKTLEVLKKVANEFKG